MKKDGTLHILVVEDEAKVARALREGLQREHYEVSIARTGEDGFFRMTEQEFDLVILDIMLPKRDGLEVLKALRKQGKHTPVLVLTARDTLEDRVLGLNSGADDYLVKPFAFAELIARVRALLRRTDQALRLKVHDLEVDVIGHRVSRAGKDLDLTHREYELLVYLVRHQGETVSRDMLGRALWTEVSRATPLTNVIDVHMARIRRKVDDGFDTKLIHTVRGVGYALRHES
jgi:two-component system, OmpR family, copper resistance phosphate regulon response regulator CusR